MWISSTATDQTSTPDRGDRARHVPSGGKGLLPYYFYFRFSLSLICEQGQALYWGTSEWPALDILDAWHIAKREGLVPPTMEQPEYCTVTVSRGSLLPPLDLPHANP
jgi:hypothetical protein